MCTERDDCPHAVPSPRRPAGALAAGYFLFRAPGPAPPPSSQGTIRAGGVFHRDPAPRRRGREINAPPEAGAHRHVARITTDQKPPPFSSF